MTDITDHLAEIQRRVHAALKRSGRTANCVSDASDFTVDHVTIVAVSKQQTVAAIRSACRAGLRHFGESYVQEAEYKIPRISEPGIQWHFLGHIQANKTRQIAVLFDWVHTVDRIRVAQRLNDQRPHHAPPLNVFLQVDQTGLPGRSGISEAELPALLQAVSALPRLRVRGLMTLPPAEADDEAVASHFRRLRDTAARLGVSGMPLQELSIGMSDDFELAVAEGATFVRIGTALFGQRTTDHPANGDAEHRLVQPPDRTS